MHTRVANLSPRRPPAMKAWRPGRGAPTLPVEQVRLATRHHVEALWRAGAVYPQVAAVDPAAEPGVTRALRGGELITVPPADVFAKGVKEKFS
jgi:hypothetical protein